MHEAQPRLRVIVVVAVTAVTGFALTISAAHASAATARIGSLPAPGLAASCVGCTGFQISSAPAGKPYEVPPGKWTIQGWRIAGGTGDGRARLRVFRATGNPNEYTFLSQSAEQNVPGQQIARLTARLEVRGGDVIGVRTNGPDTPVFFPGSPGDMVESALSEPAVGQTLSPSGSDVNTAVQDSTRVNVLAELYHGPPATTLKRRPRPRTTSRSARFKFSSDAFGASFSCSLDDARFKPCSSPRSYRHLSAGIHRFRVRARDRDGRLDPTPARARWRVVG